MPLAVLYAYYLVCVGGSVTVFAKLAGQRAVVGGLVGLASGLLVATLVTAVERTYRVR